MTEPAWDIDAIGEAPPHNLDAEMAILGAMLLNRSTIEIGRASCRERV